MYDRSWGTSRCCVNSRNSMNWRKGDWRISTAVWQPTPSMSARRKSGAKRSLATQSSDLLVVGQSDFLQGLTCKQASKEIFSSSESEKPVSYSFPGLSESI